MKDRKGFILATVLAIITALTMIASFTTYVIMRKTRLTVAISDSIKALKAAESGVEVALVRLKEDNITCNETLDDIVNGTINNATYSVNMTEEGDGCLITSKGEKNGAIRIVEVKAFVNKTDNNSITIEFWKTY